MAFTNVFRQSFSTKLKRDKLLWFPGHMTKGFKQMKQMLKDVDCVIEVHDARIPISGRNELFQTQLLGVRPHILLLNKCDLINMKENRDTVTKCLKGVNGISEVLFSDCRTPEGKGVEKIIPTVVDIMSNTNRFHRTHEKNLNLLVIGVPNVGKSSLINVLRNLHTKRKNATKVGAIAGITRSVLHKIQVCYDPPMYLLDTPGILEPNVRNVESALRLALCASMQDHLVGETLIADYMLYWMNKNNFFRYVEVLGLDKPFNDIIPFLTAVANKNQITSRIRDFTHGGYTVVPNFTQAASTVLKLFRTGKFGKFVIDSDLLSSN